MLQNSILSNNFEGLDIYAKTERAVVLGNETRTVIYENAGRVVLIIENPYETTRNQLGIYNDGSLVAELINQTRVKVYAPTFRDGQHAVKGFDYRGMRHVGGCDICVYTKENAH